MVLDNNCESQDRRQHAQELSRCFFQMKTENLGKRATKIKRQRRREGQGGPERMDPRHIKESLDKGLRERETRQSPAETVEESKSLSHYLLDTLCSHLVLS